MRRKTFNLMKQYLVSVMLVCSSTIIGLLLSEVVLNSVWPERYLIWPPNMNMTFHPSKDIMPGIKGQSKFVTNSDGMRGDELRSFHTNRILTLGGSTTECFYLDQSETWPNLLQKNLNENSENSHNVWVGNAGLSGKTTRHHIIAMQYLPLKKLKIDTIVLLIGVNDFSKRLSRDDNYDPYFMKKTNATKKLISETFSGGYFSNPDDLIFKRTAIWQMLRRMKRIGSNQIDKFKYRDDYGMIYVDWRKRRKQAVSMIDELPDLSLALEEYKRNIHKMIDIAQESSIRLIFMTQPTMWKEDLSEELESLLWCGGIGDFQREDNKSYYSTEALKNGMDQYNNALLDVCRERHVECVDLASILAKDIAIFYDDTHFNENGSQRVSKVLLDYILSQNKWESDLVSA